MCMKLICYSSFQLEKCKCMLNRKQVSLNSIGEPHEKVLLFFDNEPVFLHASGIASLLYPHVISYLTFHLLAITH